MVIHRETSKCVEVEVVVIETCCGNHRLTTKRHNAERREDTECDSNFFHFTIGAKTSWRSSLLNVRGEAASPSAHQGKAEHVIGRNLRCNALALAIDRVGSIRRATTEKVESHAGQSPTLRSVRPFRATRPHTKAEKYQRWRALAFSWLVLLSIIDRPD